MTERPLILIIGGGLLGLASARACLDRGANIIVAERKTQTGHGAGFANSGMIHPSQSWPWMTQNLSSDAQTTAAQNVALLAKNSRRLLESRMKELGLSDLNRVKGCNKIFNSAEARERAKRRYIKIDIQAENTDCLNHPALYFPDDFSGSALAWSQAETKALVKDGAQIQTGVHVRLEKKQGRLKAYLNGTHQTADHIILCAGHQTGTLLTSLGLNLPITPVRGFALDFDLSSIESNYLPQMPVMDAASHSALTCFGSRLRLSGTLNEDSARPLWQRWYEIMPSFMSRLGRPIQVWSGNRPISGLGRPIIAQSPIKGLWVNCGHGHMGWTLSMGSGALMADIIMTGTSASNFGWPKT